MSTVLDLSSQVFAVGVHTYAGLTIASGQEVSLVLTPTVWPVSGDVVDIIISIGSGAASASFAGQASTPAGRNGGGIGLSLDCLSTVNLTITLNVQQAFTGSIVVTAVSRSYQGNFTPAQDPLASPWSQGPDSTASSVMSEPVAQSSGLIVAHATMASGQTGAPYNDSQAMLTGFGPSHTVTAIVWKAASINNNLNCEVEIRLGMSVGTQYNPSGGQYGPTSTYGYEININQTGFYLNLGHFKGPALVAMGPSQLGFTPKTGDIFKAQLDYRSTGLAYVYVWWNGALLPGFPFQDTSPPPPGLPGIGFYVDAGQANNEYGFSSVMVTSP